MITYEDNVFNDKFYDIKSIPSITGIDDVSGWLTESGVEVLLEKIEADSCFVAEVKDSEGNRICLKQDF